MVLPPDAYPLFYGLEPLTKSKRVFPLELRAKTVLRKYLPVVIVVVSPRVGARDGILLLDPAAKCVVRKLSPIDCIVGLSYLHEPILVIVVISIALPVFCQIACGAVGEGITADAVVPVGQIVDRVVRVITPPRRDARISVT
jgi:hypothetical protein